MRNLNQAPKATMFHAEGRTRRAGEMEVEMLTPLAGPFIGAQRHDRLHVRKAEGTRMCDAGLAVDRTPAKKSKASAKAD